MDRELFRRLRPHVTIYSRQASVNPAIATSLIKEALADAPLFEDIVIEVFRMRQPVLGRK